MQLPWLNPIYEQLIKFSKQHSLPHGIVLYGPDGVGKQQLSQEIAKQLLAPHDSLESHPDFHEIKLNPGESIGIDLVRAWIPKLQLQPQAGGMSVGVINHAHNLTLQAANALLKTLEEPNPKTFIILTATHPHQLIPTIRSRLQAYTLPSPTRELAMEWLKREIGGEDFSDESLALALNLHHGAPLAAKRYLEDKEAQQMREAILLGVIKLVNNEHSVCAMVSQWQKWPLQITLMWLYSVISDMIKLNNKIDAPYVRNQDKLLQLQEILGNVQLNVLWGWLRQIGKVCIHSQEATLNTALVLENIFLTK